MPALWDFCNHAYVQIVFLKAESLTRDMAISLFPDFLSHGHTAKLVLSFPYSEVTSSPLWSVISKVPASPVPGHYNYQNLFYSPYSSSWLASPFYLPTKSKHKVMGWTSRAIINMELRTTEWHHHAHACLPAL